MTYQSIIRNDILDIFDSYCLKEDDKISMVIKNESSTFNVKEILGISHLDDNTVPSSAAFSNFRAEGSSVLS